MAVAEQALNRDDAKKATVFETASTVFSQYGFRRTTMNDIAEAAGISRPALYLLFENKEHLFIELVTFRFEEAIAAATASLEKEGAIQERFGQAILDFERIFYEPIADSPHGAELMDTNLNLKNDKMMAGIEKLFSMLTEALKQAEKSGEINFANAPAKSDEFVSLLFTAIGGIKQQASSGADFRKKVEQVTHIFLQTLSN